MTNTRVDAIANSNFMNSQAIKYETPLVGNQGAHSTHKRPHQCLHHVGPLQSETLDCLEYIQDALCLHPLQDRTQRTEGPCSTSTSTV